MNNFQSTQIKTASSSLFTDLDILLQSTVFFPIRSFLHLQDLCLCHRSPSIPRTQFFFFKKYQINALMIIFSYGMNTIHIA